MPEAFLLDCKYPARKWHARSAACEAPAASPSPRILPVSLLTKGVAARGAKSLCPRGCGHSPACLPMPRTTSCFASWDQLTCFTTPANTPGLAGCPCGDSAFGEQMLSPCPHGHPEGSWALPHRGAVVVVPFPSPGYRQWPGACGGRLASTMPPVPPLSLRVLLLLSLSCCSLPCCMHGQGSNSPHPFTESQNVRGWKGSLWVIQSNPPAEAGSPTAGCTGPCPGGA